MCTPVRLSRTTLASALYIPWCRFGTRWRGGNFFRCRVHVWGHCVLLHLHVFLAHSGGTSRCEESGFQLGEEKQKPRREEEMLKCLSRAVSIAARLTHKAPSAPALCRAAEPLVRPALCAPTSATSRPFTRSLWMMCGNNGAASDSRGKLLTSKHTFPSCGCGALHTEGKIPHVK